MNYYIFPLILVLKNVLLQRKEPIFELGQPIAIHMVTDPKIGLVAKSDFNVWRAMVEAAWCGTLASMSLLLQKTSDEQIIHYVLNGGFFFVLL